MKNVLKLFSILALFLSTLSFAQYSPDGCIPLPDPLKDLIKKQLPKDMLPIDTILDADNMGNYLLKFNSTYEQNYNGNPLSQEDLDTILEHKDNPQAAHITAYINSASDLEDLRSIIESKISSENDQKVVQALVLLHYETQIIENYTAKSAMPPKWRCYLSIAVGAAVGGAIGSTGGAAGAVLGSAIGGAIGAQIGCN